MLNADADLSTIQDLLDHNSIRTTQRQDDQQINPPFFQYREWDFFSHGACGPAFVTD